MSARILKRDSQKAKSWKCGFGLAKYSGRVWWIEYYDHDKQQRRERIGSNKAALQGRPNGAAHILFVL